MIARLPRRRKPLARQAAFPNELERPEDSRTQSTFDALLDELAARLDDKAAGCAREPLAIAHRVFTRSRPPVPRARARTPPNPQP